MPPVSIDTLETLPESTLRELCVAGAVRECTVVGLKEGGFALTLVYGGLDRLSSKVLGTSRGGLRRFAALNTAATFLRELHVETFSVDMTDYEPGLLRAPRPDRAEALKKTRTTPRQESLPL
jgi:hypothetical protein